MKEKMYKIFSENFDEYELKVLHRDLLKGGDVTKKLLERRLKQMQREKQKECLVCGNPIQNHNDKFVLHFGPDDFQKRATFCAADCLEYFMKRMKKKQDSTMTLDRSDNMEKL